MLHKGADGPFFHDLGPDAPNLAKRAMSIKSLTIRDLRVLKHLQMEPRPRLNFVIGSNGAGKTSILEGIYLAGRGRTFRHSDARPVISAGAEETQVVVKIEREDAFGRRHEKTLGIARSGKDLRCRLNGADIRRRSQLAEALPVQWIGSQPQGLMEMGPDIRRRFLDMAVFHVEHRYLKDLSEFQRALRQRNASLRTGDEKAVRSWDEPLAIAGEAIASRRGLVLERIIERLTHQVAKWDIDPVLDCQYRRGWPSQHSLFAELSKRTREDLERGFTTRGPHRADLVFYAGGGNKKRELIEKSLSRGQLKMFVIALHLAVMDVVMGEDKAREPVLLVDDLAAELDFPNRERVVDAIEARGCQAFVTRLTDDRLPQGEGCGLFHVEQGELV